MTPEETLYFLQSAQALARYHQALGIEYYPASAKLFAIGQMSGPKQGRYESAKGADTPGNSGQPSNSPKPAAVRAVREEAPVARVAPTMARMPELSTCRLCAESDIQPLTARAGRCGQEPRLLVVGDYRHGASPDGDAIFGQEEDELLAKMLTAIALTGDDVLVTNLVKCLPARNDTDAEPGEVVAGRCLVHLRQQILLTRPRLILAMGDLPARILVGKKASLSALRGRLHNFFCQDGSPNGQPNGSPASQPVPVLVSYHPAFLLAQTEMKKAAWEDLKMARRFLASQPLTVRAAGR